MSRFRSVISLAAASLIAAAVLIPTSTASAVVPPYAADIYQGIPATIHGEPMQQIPLEVIVRGEPAPEVHLQLRTEIEGQTYWSNVGWQTGYTKITPPNNDFDYYYKVDFKMQSGVEDVSQMRIIATNEYSDPINPQVSVSTVTLESPYTITGQPLSQSVNEGDSAFISASVSVADWATGTPSLSVQKANDLGGWDTIYGPVPSTTIGISFANQQYPEDDQSQYRIRWMTTYNYAVYSDVATISVIPPDSPAVVTQQPQDVEMVEGDNASFQAAASGYPVPSVAWEFSSDGSSNWTEVDGANSTTLSLTTPAVEGWYRAVFTNFANGGETIAVTNEAKLTITTVPAVSWVSAPTSVTSGQAAAFTIAVSGRPDPTIAYQMMESGNWVDIPGASGTTFQSEILHWIDGDRSFRVGVTNKNGTVWSSTATVQVNMDASSLNWTDTTIGVFQIGDPFSDQISASSTQTVSYNVASGSLPDGISLDSATGTITGQPLTAGTGSVSIAATTIDAEVFLALDASVLEAASLQINADFADRTKVEGSQFSIQGENLQPGSTWTVDVHSSPIRIADGTVAGGGALASQFLTLPTLDPGEHHLILTVIAASGATKTTQIDFIVGTDGRFGSAPQLANTGLDSSSLQSLLALGAGALGFGALLALAAIGFRREVRESARQ